MSLRFPPPTSSLYQTMHHLLVRTLSIVDGQEIGFEVCFVFTPPLFFSILKPLIPSVHARPCASPLVCRTLRHSAQQRSSTSRRFHQGVARHAVVTSIEKGHGQRNPDLGGSAGKVRVGKQQRQRSILFAVHTPHTTVRRTPDLDMPVCSRFRDPG